MSNKGVSQSYVFDQSGLDHERLTRQARVQNEFSADACVRAGLKTGARAIDVGCGPLGALPVLAELVGPGGTVVGLDASRTALAQARQALDSLGLCGVELIEADVNALDDASSLWGKFDLAHCRLLLMYQPDPAATLRRMSRLVRSGGRVVAVDFLRDANYPRFHPPVPASERINHLFFALVERRGGTPDVAQQYRRLCEEANLRLIEQRGWFWVADDPGDLLALYRDAFVSMRPSLVAENLTTDEEINALVRETDTARCTTEFGAYVLMVAMIADVP
jgi:ubiquinone/menaquinone biosynthesis C-methylase UbiE